ncbi:lysosome-associated membrane glycoprotein 5 isoform X2 [Culicoides brevitarsis]|uniref:lysosome-associated membrane glycoprotein 5 isoform X2 n=1 Tax=Culicoides brevitarsis TaxID=469753 RepID=UPI00307B4D49
MNLEFFSIVIFIGLISGITSQSLSTKRPSGKTGKAAKTTPFPSTSALYRLNNQNGVTCTLVESDALLTIHYFDKAGQKKDVNMYLPDQVDIKGNCGEDESSLIVTHEGFTMTLWFAKTPGRERWYLRNSEVTYSTSNPKFENIYRPGIDVRLVSAENSYYFATPAGRSFLCANDTVVNLSGDEDDRTGHTAELSLRKVHVQAFMFKKKNAWGPDFICSATGTYRDEAAPLYTGLTLAFAGVGTIAGYGVYRYMKIKKFQYGTMA